MDQAGMSKIKQNQGGVERVSEDEPGQARRKTVREWGLRTSMEKPEQAGMGQSELDQASIFSIFVAQ